ncbi:MAG: choice-of-anchor Q domain-containing protein [Dokdonella sp.]|uniref:choice-of-anchor Q domain-containing protein n=1 Tax=Dokdonella sp. TaxID=2291710 RepID=UPI003F81B08D
MTRHLRLLRPVPLAAALACALPVDAAVPATPTKGVSARHALRLEARRRPPHARAPHAPAPRGATLPVTHCLDDDSPGSLRSVLASAAEGDVVDLSALTCSTITLTQGPLDTSVLGEHHLYDVTLQGPGRHALTIEAGGQSQVLVIGGFSSNTGTFTVNDLTIANGSYAGSLAACIEGFGGTLALNRVTVTNCHASGTYSLVLGGAVDVTTLVMTDSSITNSTLTATGTHGTGAGGGAYASDGATLVRSTISGNSVTAPYASYDGYASVGGGLYSRGELSLVDSTISGNTITATLDGENANGGGIYVRGTATISGSTIDGNVADGHGGGLHKALFSVYGEPPPPQDTALAIINSTIDGNTADGGAGVYSVRPVTISNSTVTSNFSTVTSGAGLLFADASQPLSIMSTIFAANTVCETCSPPEPSDIATFDIQSPLAVTGSNNLVQAAAANVSLPSDTIDADPLLFPLAWNGGPTRTRALGAGSPALDAGGNPAALVTDQRGGVFARVSGAAADIGAFETQQPPADTIFADGFDGPIVPIAIDHAYDDGDGDTNQGPPSTFDPDMLWGNYFAAAPGGEIVTRISVAFGPTFPSLANGSVTFWLLEDDDGDGDPRNAHAVASATATPDVFNDTFFVVDLPPTYVQGGFFVGASAKLDGGADRPARVDTGASGHDSWFFYAPDIAATIDDLASAPFGTRNDDPQYVVLPGAFMVRAHGTTVP